MKNHLADGIYAALVAAPREVGDLALCEALEKLASKTGRNLFRHAAAVVRGRSRGGRKPIDDGAALRRIAAYAPDRRREAVGALALQMADGDQRKANTIAHRWREKLRKEANETEETGASAGSGV